MVPDDQSAKGAEKRESEGVEPVLRVRRTLKLGSRKALGVLVSRYHLFKRWLLVVILVLLGVAFWRSGDVKTIAAGVAIFLFGMAFLEEGFTAFTGGFLEKILKSSTDTLFKSHVFGIVSTSLMQSSSLVSVITISFLSAGLIDLLAGIGIIFGANIGTTTGAWLMAGFGVKVKISAYAMPMLVFGLILSFQGKKELKGTGKILGGLGFLFLGIHYMKEGFEAFQHTIDLAAFAMPGYGGLFVFAGIGILATVIMQSSHATLMLIIAALAAGQITYENALALAIGANIGTTITAILGSLSSNIAGRRLAAAHLIFNTVTAVIAIAFIKQFRWIVDEVAGVVGIAADDWTLKLAVFHTLFNVVGVLVMVPLASRLARFLEAFFVGSADEDGEVQTLYLNEAALQYPDTALEVLRKETLHLFENAFEIVAHGLNLHREDIRSDRRLETIVHQDDSFEIDVMPMYYRRIKSLYNEIVAAATRVRVDLPLSELQSKQVHGIRIVCRHIAEIVRDVSSMRANVKRFAASSNEDIKEEYNQIRQGVARTLRQALRIRDTEDDVLALLIIRAMQEELEEADVLANGTLDRLVRQSLITSRMATSLMNDSSYVYDIRKRVIEIAQRIFLPEGSDLRQIEDEFLLQEGDFSEVAMEKDEATVE